VDIILFDSEDYGQPENSKFPQQEDSWCLGSQYWSKNPHVQNYYARFGILLDMVGGKEASFTREDVSVHYAPSVCDKVWNTATRAGYSGYFIYDKITRFMVTDDHYYINELANIPCIDIIQNAPSTESHFNACWHTLNDNMKVIDKSTLKAVGQTVLAVVYREK
jgi:hypothetical protein